LREREFDDVPLDTAEDIAGEDSVVPENHPPDSGNLFTSPEEPPYRPHPLVRRLSDFLLRSIDAWQRNKVYSDEVMENQPLVRMIDAVSTANTPLATTIARTSQPWRSKQRPPPVRESMATVRGVQILPATTRSKPLTTKPIEGIYAPVYENNIRECVRTRLPGFPGTRTAHRPNRCGADPGSDGILP